MDMRGRSGRKHTDQQQKILTFEGLVDGVALGEWLGDWLGLIDGAIEGARLGDLERD